MLPIWIRSQTARSEWPRRRACRLYLGAITILSVAVAYLWLTRAPPCPDLSILGAKRTTSPWLMEPRYFKGPKYKVPENMNKMPVPLPPRKPTDVVPSVVHLTYGLQHGGRPEFSYTSYLAVRSSVLRLKPEKIYFHYFNEPDGPWWEAVKPLLTLHKLDNIPTEIFGKPIGNTAHAADVIRMYAMQQSGGIYLDMDVIVIRDFDDLLSYPTTMGLEAEWWGIPGPMDVAGLCNGVIIAQPDAPFINRWLDRYQDFNTSEWAFHSVHLPWQLAKQNPEELQVLGHKAFFYPLWTEQGVDYVHLQNTHDFYASGQYAFHVWNTAGKYLVKLSPNAIRKHNTSFMRLVYPLMGDDDDRLYEEYVKWKQARGETVPTWDD